MHVICRGPRGHAGKGHLRAGLVLLAVSATALCLTGVSPASAASAAPAGRHPAGTVLAWGDNSFAELGNGSTAPSSTPVRVHLPAHTRVTAVAAGEGYGLALTSRGRVLAWGNNYAGALGDGRTADSSTPVAVDLPAGTRVTAISAGFFDSLALTP
jgi:alpha-tubulin suppressor-like RCC1 family protein